MPARRSVRIGIIGAGFAARLHLENYALAHGVEVSIAGIYSPTTERSQRLAAEFGGLHIYPTVDDLLADQSINLVDLCVPNSQHTPLIVRCAAAGKDVVCEKPLTGFFGDGEPGVGRRYDRATMLTGALQNADLALDALAQDGRRLHYAEN